MKWSLMMIALLGAMTFAAIFVAQSQYEQGEQRSPVVASDDAPVEEQVADEPGFAAAGSLAAAAVSAVSEEPRVSEESESEEDAPVFEGDAWVAGVRAFEAGDYELAAAALQVAVAEKEDSSYRHYLRGLTLRRLGELDEAANELERSLELAPSAVRAAVNLARVRLELGETEAARQAVDAALDCDLDHADAWHVLGRIELAEGNLSEAEAAFARAVRSDAGHAWAQNNLGYTRILQEQFAEAVPPLKSAVASGKEEAVFFNNLGVALERTGHEDLAAVSFGRAALIGHGDAEASYERVAARLAERGLDVASLDDLESLDAGTLIARIDEAFATEALVAAAAGEDFESAEESLEEFTAAVADDSIER